MGESALIFLLVATVNCTNNRGVAVFELCPWCWAREHWGLFTSLFTGPFESAAPTKQLEWQPINMTRHRSVGSDMSGVWWGWGPFTSAACRFESVAPPNTKRYFYADCCGVNNSTVLSLRLHFVFQAQRRRPYIPRFSFKTNRGEPQVGLFTGEAGAESCVVLLCGEADTSTCGSQDLVRSQ